MAVCLHTTRECTSVTLNLEINTIILTLMVQKSSQNVALRSALHPEQRRNGKFELIFVEEAQLLRDNVLETFELSPHISAPT